MKVERSEDVRAKPSRFFIIVSQGDKEERRRRGREGRERRRGGDMVNIGGEF